MQNHDICFKASRLTVRKVPIDFFTLFIFSVMPFKMCSKVLRKHENPYKKCVLLGTKMFFQKTEIPDFAFKIVVFYSLQHTIFTFLKKACLF